MDANTGALYFGIAVMLFIQWRSGANKAGTETVAMYKARDEVQDKEIKRRDEQISKLTHEVGKLTGIIEGQKERILTLESVDISRNPVMLKFMEYITKVTERSEKYMDFTEKESHQIMSILVEIKTFMGNINKHMEQPKGV